MKILAIHNGTGSRYYRLNPQLRYMKQIGNEVNLIEHEKLNKKQIENSDIVIFQMVFSLEWVKLAKKLGKKVIFECDDLIHSVPKTHYAYKEIKGFKKIKMFYDIWRVLRVCDGFISTNKKLNRMYGWMSRKSLVFDNYIDMNHWKQNIKGGKHPKVRMLWAGSTSHTGDLLMIKPILKQTLENKNIQFIYVGMGGIKTEDLYAKFIYGDDFFEGLPKNRESILPVPANVWSKILAGLQVDFAIAPLEKNNFNKYKSQCKFLEYAINKIPAVYSKHHYSEVQHGITGFLADTEEDWLKYTSLLANDKQLRKQMGQAAYDWAISNKDIKNYLHKWQTFVEKI